MSGVRIKCDAPGCGALYPPAPVRGGYKALTQRNTIRPEAIAAGWSISAAGEFCPTHSSPEAELRAAAQGTMHDAYVPLDTAIAIMNAKKLDVLIGVAGALGRALHPEDDEQFWGVCVELEKDFPQISWHNSMTDGGSKAKP